MNLVFWSVFEVVTNITEMSLIMMFINSFFEDEARNRTKSLCAIAFQSTLLTILNKVFHAGSLSTMLIIVISWFIILNIILGRKMWYKYLMLICISMIIMILSELIIVFTIQLIFGIKPIELQENNTYRFVTIVFSKLIVYFIIKNINYFKLKLSARKKWQTINLSLVFIINIIISFSIFDIYHEISQLNDQYFGRVIIITFMVCIVNILIVTLINTMAKHIEEEIKMDQQKQYYQVQLRQIEESNKLIKIIRQRQHEFNNHLSTLLSLMLHKKHDKAEDYLNELICVNKKTNNTIHTSNSLIAIMLNYKVEHAREIGISVLCNIDVPSDLDINIKDIAIVINNAMDNAIEACSYVEKEKRYIKINVYIKGAYLNIYIENSSDGYYHLLNQELLTRKANTNDHGHGLNNIKYILERCNGFYHINPKEDHFIFKCNMMINNV